MTAYELVADLNARGVRLTLAGDAIKFAPASVVRAADRSALRVHKREIVAMLSSSPNQQAFPIVPGTKHFSLLIHPDDVAAGRWGQEFRVGHHFDLRQPSLLRSLMASQRSSSGEIAS